MRIFLTGGSGMVGRNLLEAFASTDAELLHPSSHELNLTDMSAVAAYIDFHKPEFVIHAAGKVGGIKANIADPVSFLDVNNAIGRNVIMGAFNAGVKKFLNLASTCMYPKGAQNPLETNQILTGPLEETNEGYALAKILCTKLCQFIDKSDPSLHYKTLIPCNLFGKYDKFDSLNSHLVPAVIQKIHQAKINGNKEVEIWGDGSSRREFLFAADLAAIIIQAIDNFESLPNVMNIGFGSDRTVLEYYENIATVVGWRGNFLHLTSLSQLG